MSNANILDSEQGERAYAVGSDMIDAILRALGARDREALTALLDPLHAADIADILEQIGQKEREEFIELWGHEFDGEVLAEIDEALSEGILRQMPDSVVGGAFRDMETDDVVDLVEGLQGWEQERVLRTLDAAGRAAVESALLYPEESAGRLMQRELVMAPSHWNIGNAIDFLRTDIDLPERFYDVVMVNPKLEPVGKVPLSSLMSNKRDVLLCDIMDQEFRTIPVLQDQADVAYAFNQYNMVSAPVVDAQNRLVGVITMDDAMEVLEEEAEEDIQRLVGLGSSRLTDGILVTTRRRFPWLAVNLITSVLASIVIAQFADTIETLVALAVLMPIVASMGGNAGTQSLTIAVRALATKDLTAANAWRVIRRETSVGLLNGVVFALIIGGVGIVWYGSPLLGVVLGLAMLFNLLVAGSAGILIPLSLDKMGIDPALASGAFVTTVTDIVGFFVFLGLAALILL